MKTQLFLLLLIASANTVAQSVVPSNLRASLTLDQMGSGNSLQANGIMYGIPLPPPEVEGDTYYDLEWCEGNIALFEKDRIYNKLRLRYDIYSNGLEVRVDDKILFVSAERVKGFVYTDSKGNPHTFINPKVVNGNAKGFYEVLADGKISLLKSVSVTIKKSDYQPALQVGNKNHRILKTPTLYYAKDGVTTELPKQKKKAEALLLSLGVITEDDKGLDLKKEQVLTSLFYSFNSK